MDSMAWLVAVIFTALLIVVVISGQQEYEKQELLKATGGRAKGLIVRNNFHWGRISVLYSVVRFTTAEGLTIETEYRRGAATAIPKYAAGTQVWVAYDRANPNEFVILTPGRFS